MPRLRSIIACLEPLYDWGRRTIFRMAARERDFSDESEGEAWFFELQWLGLHFEVQVGRTPPKISEAEVAERKLADARRKVEREAEWDAERAMRRDIKARAAAEAED